MSETIAITTIKILFGTTQAMIHLTQAKRPGSAPAYHAFKIHFTEFTCAKLSDYLWYYFCHDC